MEIGEYSAAHGWGCSIREIIQVFSGVLSGGAFAIGGTKGRHVSLLNPPAMNDSAESRASLLCMQAQETRSFAISLALLSRAF
jgi:hypothetical protein